MVYTSSFSKTVAPGSSVGYFILPPELRAELEATSVSTYITPGLLGQATVYEFMRRGNFDSNLARVRDLLRARRDAMLDALDAELGGTGATWSRPQGGYFVWLDVPGADAGELLGRSTEAGVTFVPGTDFGGASVDGAAGVQLRLAGRDPRGRSPASRAASVRGDALAARAAARRSDRSPG